MGVTVIAAFLILTSPVIGKMNAFTFQMIKEWNKALDACAHAEAVAVVGNAKAFSAGFDLSVMGAGPSPEARDMLFRGGELMLRLAEFPRPVVIGATGHALALGAIALFTADYRVGPASAKAKTGLTEVAIGMQVPEFALALGRERLNPAYLTRATALAEVFDSTAAQQAGYYDHVADDPAAVAIELAKGFSEYRGDAFPKTKGLVWANQIAFARERLEADLKMFAN